MSQSYRPGKLADLPKNPGVYYMYDQSGTIIYVGKATSLRARVNSYWQRPQNQQISRFLFEVDHIKIRETPSVLEALILEANEIKRLQPRHNAMQKDDKRFAQIIITREEFPQILVVRPTDERKLPVKASFGPYLSAHSAKIALKLLRRIFPYRCNRPAIDPIVEGEVPRQARDTRLMPRACVYYHLGLCPGTCVGAITKERYAETIQRLVEFLNGKRTAVVRSLKRSMILAGKRQDYEAAAKLRDQLFALEHIHDVALMTDDDHLAIAQFPIQRIEAYDISLAAGRDAVGSMVVLHYGVPATNEYRHFKIRTVSGTNDVAMLAEVLTRRIRHAEWSMPDIFAIDGGIPQRNAATKALRASGIEKPVVIGITKGPERKRADLIMNNAAEALVRHYGLDRSDLERVLRIARDESHRFAITYHRKVRSARTMN